MTAASPWQRILRQLLRRLSEKGFVVRTTFDLQLARRSLANTEEVLCPHHGSDRCTCQYLVLQMSRHGESSPTLVVHGHDNSTKLLAVGDIQDGAVAMEICQALEHVLKATRGSPRSARAATARSTPEVPLADAAKAAP